VFAASLLVGILKILVNFEASETQENPPAAGSVYLLTQAGKTPVSDFVGPVQKRADGMTEWKRKNRSRSWTNALLIFEEQTSKSAGKP
jgi:hypothetical protein